jgi:hypothetical protein
VSLRATVLLLSPLLIALPTLTAPAGALVYPSDPQQALAQYTQLKTVLRADPHVPAQNLAAADQSLRGKTVEVRGRFQSMVHWQEGENRAHYLFLLQTPEGVTLTLHASEPLQGIRLDEPVRVLASLPAESQACEFQLDGVLRESDAPPEPPAPKAGPSLTAASPAQGPPRASCPAPPAPTVQPVWDGVPATPGGGGRLPDLPDVGMDQAGLSKWKAWVSKINPHLTDLQLELTVRWVIAYSAIYGVDHRLSFAMIHAESDFDPMCRSSAGALGMTQIMYNELDDLGCSNPWNVQQNIRAGIRELSEDLRRFTGRPNYEQCVLGLAAYNAGPNAVKKYGGVPPYRETQNYVVKVSREFLELVQGGYP